MKIRTLSFGVLMFAVILNFSSCYYDKKELVYPKDTTGCDTASITYNGQINSLLTEKCTNACHGSTAALNGGGARFDSYSGAKTYGPSMVVQVESGLMPKGGPALDNCNIARIRTWVRNGMPEN